MVNVAKAQAPKPRYAIRKGGSFYAGHLGDAGPDFTATQLSNAALFSSPEDVEAFIAEHKKWTKGVTMVPSNGNQPGTPGVPPRPQHENAFDGYELVEVY